MIERREIFQFGDYKLDVAEGILSCGDKNISLTPKMFETLRILLENAGHIVEKDELMRRIWHDRFVEENNLTFNIKMLRKVLGDDARKPTFIETVPRRGYRFVAKVSDPETDDLIEIVENETPKPTPTPTFGLKRIFAVSMIIAAICSIVYATLIWQKKQVNVPILSNDFSLVKVTNSGSIICSAISPDGEYIVYATDSDRKNNIWLFEIETGKNTNIFQPSGKLVLFQINFSSDRKNLFFTAKAENELAGIFNFSLVDKTLTKIISNTEGAFNVSPDNSKIAFIRYDQNDNRRNSLMIADIDGRNENVVRQSERSEVYWTVAFSIDGKKIAAAYGHTDSGSQNISLVETDVETGEQKNIIGAKFFNIKSVNYLRNEENLIISAAENISQPIRIWEVDAETGNHTALTSDSVSYKQVILNKSNDKLLALSVTSDFNLFSMDLGDQKSERKITQSTNGFGFTSENRLVYAADSKGSSDIWSMNVDGSDPRQLTTESHLDGYPIVSEDGKFIYFTSNRTGEMQVWRMNQDGSAQTQITKSTGGIAMFAPKGGEILYYQKTHSKGIWKFSIESGEDTEIAAGKQALFSSFSPDGRNLAMVVKETSGNYKIDLLDVEKKEIIKSFPSPEKRVLPTHLNWIPRLNAFSYVIEKSTEADAIWIQDVNAETPKFSQTIGNEEISDFKFSDHGKKLFFIRGKWKQDTVLISGLK